MANDFFNKPVTRKQAVKLAGAGIAALALGPEAVFGGESGMDTSRKVRLGVVGGGFGTDFQWSEHPGCIVEAVSDLLPVRRQILQDVYQCPKAYNSLEELILDPKVEAVAVFTGAPDHVRHSVAAMRQGKHVISAVPAAITLEQAEELLAVKEETGLTYMMAETSYYQQAAISARKFWNEGRFGNLVFCRAMYHHPGLETLWFNADGSPTWRHSYPPMLYPTHSTAFLVGVTGDRLTEVSCIGWGDGADIMKNNQYHNPFLSEVAFFETDRGGSFEMEIFWKAAVGGCERAEWYGDQMSFYMAHPNGLGPIIRRASEQIEKDDAGFERALATYEAYQQPLWWQTDLLPEPLRHDSGHDGSHTFLTHEFVSALLEERSPTVDIYEALSYTVPGIVAHESAMKQGEHLRIPVYHRPKA